MTKQEKIREGIAETLYTFEYDGWGRLSEGDRVMWLSRAEAVMNKEHSLGVVVKVERGTDIIHMDKNNISLSFPSTLLNGFGYEAVEPLIEEVKDVK